MLQEFFRVKSALQRQQLRNIYARMLFFLAFLRSSGAHDDALCDECLAHMHEDGIALERHMYSAVLLHVDSDRRARYVFFI